MSTKEKQLATDTSLLAGIQKYMPTGTLTVLSQPETAAQVMAVIQVRLDKAQAVITARSTLHQAILDSDAEYAQTEPYVQSVRQSVQAMYVGSPATLSGFGILPKKARVPLTAAKKVLAAAKREATRKARGTMGKKAKASIVGALNGPVMVAADGTVTSASSGSSASAPVATTTSPAATPVGVAANGTTNGSSAGGPATHS
jgi:hypothetical protein